MKKLTAVDHSMMPLGKREVKHDSRTLQLAHYIDAAVLPAPPVSIAVTTKIKNWLMMLNDTIGDCTIAAMGHLIMLWTVLSGKLFTPTNAQIKKAYTAVTKPPFNPKTGANDNGAVILDVLNYARKTGIAGRKIFAFVSTGTTNLSHIKSAISIFGGIDIGVELPISAQTQAIWGEGGSGGSAEPGSWGGHSICCVAYDSKYMHFISWGKEMKMTWAFWKKYVSESYAIISPDFLSGGKTPAGLDMAALQKDLKAL